MMYDYRLNFYIESAALPLIKMETRKQKNKWQEVDGLFGWVQVFAAGITYFCLPSIQRTFGLLYEGLIDKYKRSDTVTSWVPSVNQTVKMCSSPIVGYLVQRFGERVVCFIGAVLSCVSLALTAVSPSFEFVFITYGLCVGFGMNCCLVACQTNVSRYFIKKRGRAMGVLFSCLSLGSLAFAPLIHFLYQEYNYVGAVLILSAIVSHTCISAVMMRPLPRSAIKDVKKDDDDIETRKGSIGIGGNDEEIEKVGGSEMSNKRRNPATAPGDGDRKDVAKNKAAHEQKLEDEILIAKHTLEKEEESETCNGSLSDRARERNDGIQKYENYRLNSDSAQKELKESHNLSSLEKQIDLKHVSEINTESKVSKYTSKEQTLSAEICQKANESQSREEIPTSGFQIYEIIRSYSRIPDDRASGMPKKVKDGTQPIDENHEYAPGMPQKVKDGTQPIDENHECAPGMPQKAKNGTQSTDENHECAPGMAQKVKDGTQSIDENHASASPSVKVNSSTCCSRCTKIGKLMIDNLRLDLLKNGSFAWICIFMFGWAMCLDITTTFQTTMIKEYGYSDTQAVTSLLVYNTIDIPSKLLSGWMYDNRILRNYKMELTAAAMFLMALFQLLYPFVLRQNFILGMVFLAISGCNRAIVGSQYVNVVATLTGREYFPNAISINRFCHGIGSFVSAPLGGFLKDTTGSYAAGYIVMSTFVLICSAIYAAAKLLKYANCIALVKLKKSQI